MPAPAIEFRGVGKSFGAIAANRDISFAIASGTIHGIVGENGAGKSTLMSLLYGQSTPDAGAILIDGAAIRLRSAADAIRLGIGMVHQHFLLVESMTVLENLTLGAPGGYGAVRESARAALVDLDTRFGLVLDPDAVIGDLPIGLRQRVEIVKALGRKARILILDEPTAVLTPDEARHLFEILRRLRNEGGTIILISHKLQEIMDVTDRVTVLRAGRLAGDLETAATDATALATLMIGRPPAEPETPPPAAPGAVVLEALGLSTLGLGPIDLALRAGEIVGVAGIAGNGQSRLLDALAGLVPAEGRLAWAGETIPVADRAATLRLLGVAHIPEDRQRRGLVPGFAAWETAILGTHRTRSLHGLLDPGVLRKETRQQMVDWNIRPLDPTLEITRFSGGNQQKLVWTREFGTAPRVLLAGQPTRGVDVGAIEQFHRRLLTLRDAGAAILMVSVELDEIIALSDRIIVMVGGRIAGELTRGSATEAALGRLMAGLPAA